MKDIALGYCDQGLSVIPCYPDKKLPRVKWKEYSDAPSTRPLVEQWWTEVPDSNIGVVTGKVSGITVIDCDSEESHNAFTKLYTGSTACCKTPRGYHYWFRYNVGVGTTVRVHNVDIDIRNDRGFVVAPGSVRDGIEYIWFEPFTGVENLDELPEEIVKLFAVVRHEPNMASDTGEYFTQGRRDEDLFHVAYTMLKGGCKADMVKQTLYMIGSSANPPFPEEEIDIKVKSAIERYASKEGHLTKDVEAYIESTDGAFSNAEIAKMFNLSTGKEHSHLAQIMKRLAKKGLIEKVGTKNGVWRLIDKSVEIIDWRKAETEEYKVDLPLGISRELVKLYPKSVCIVAGASNAGKTSFLLETIRLNQKYHNITYMNSEMGPEELKIRLLGFSEIIHPDKWNFKAIQRNDNWSDIIDPNGFNIIDYMEVYDEFWLINKHIADIHKKLDKGIAIIALQKKKSTNKFTNDYGLGGEGTERTSRLYLALDRGLIKIVKAKSFRDHTKNPNGLMKKFKLVGGWKWVPQGEWYSDVEQTKYGQRKLVDDEFITEE